MIPQSSYKGVRTNHLYLCPSSSLPQIYLRTCSIGSLNSTSFQGMHSTRGESHRRTQKERGWQRSCWHNSSPTFLIWDRTKRTRQWIEPRKRSLFGPCINFLKQFINNYNIFNRYNNKNNKPKPRVISSMRVQIGPAAECNFAWGR